MTTDSTWDKILKAGAVFFLAFVIFMPFNEGMKTGTNPIGAQVKQTALFTGPTLEDEVSGYVENTGMMKGITTGISTGTDSIK